MSQTTKIIFILSTHLNDTKSVIERLKIWGFLGKQSRRSRRRQKGGGGWPASGASFDCVAVESGVVEWEVFCVGAQQFGEDCLLLEPVEVIVDVSVHKSVHERRVRVNVDVKLDVHFLRKPVKRNDNMTNTETRDMMLTSLASISINRFFVAYRVGWAQGDGSCQCRFRSKPINEHLHHIQSCPHRSNLSGIIHYTGGRSYELACNFRGTPRPDSTLERPWKWDDPATLWRLDGC